MCGDVVVHKALKDIITQVILHRLHFYLIWINESSSRHGGVDSPGLKRRGSKGANVKMYANRCKICLEASRWLSKSLTRNQSHGGATSWGEKVGGGGDHYLGFRESSFVRHFPLKTPGSKKIAANSSKSLEKEVAWLLTQSLLMSISLCLSAGSWHCIEWEGSCCLFLQSGQDKCYLAPATGTNTQSQEPVRT